MVIAVDHRSRRAPRPPSPPALAAPARDVALRELVELRLDVERAAAPTAGELELAGEVEVEGHLVRGADRVRGRLGEPRDAEVLERASRRAVVPSLRNVATWDMFASPTMMWRRR